MTELSPKRSGRITASKGYDIMAKGKGPELFGQMAKTYANELVLERLGVEPPDFTTWQMEQGLEREPDARLIYAKSRNIKVKLPGFIIHPEFDFIGCTPDGMVMEDRNRGLLEIKSPQPKAHLEYLQNGIPPKYFAQVQFQMMVTTCTWCDFMTFNPEFPDHLKAKVYRIAADNDYQADMLDRCIQLDKLVTKLISEL